MKKLEFSKICTTNVTEDVVLKDDCFVIHNVDTN